MSADTSSTTEMVVKDDLNSTNTNNQQSESSPVNGIVHSDSIPNVNENSNEQQVESTQNNYEENSDQTSTTKTDLEPEALRKVFIGGLSYKTDDQTFREYFSKFGDIDVSRNMFICV